MSTRVRVDDLLVERGLAPSREAAEVLIRAGLVVSDSERLEKPGRLVPRDTAVRVKGGDCRYVSRGGVKLAGALDEFGVSPTGRTCLDLGASTGGFTDCLLQRRAERVFAIDVGRGQLHEKLRRDARVVCRERTHLDTVQPEQFSPRPTFAVADLSFISLKRAYPVIWRVLAPGGEAIVLVKPQFELKPEQVPKGGVVTDPALHEEVMENLTRAAEECGFRVLGRCDSPIQGGDGNREYFLHLHVPG